MKHISSKLLAASACLFLALPANAFQLTGHIVVTVVNVLSANGVYVPVARLTDVSGSHVDIAIGEQGLTHSMLYNRTALTNWVTTDLPVAKAADGTPMPAVEVIEEEILPDRPAEDPCLTETLFGRSPCLPG